MGAGGASGAVSFPAFLEDIHGHLIAAKGVNTGQGSVFEDEFFNKPDEDVISILNDTWPSNPYATFEFTDPDLELEESRDQFDLFYGAVTGYDRDNYASYITDALLSVTGPSSAIDDLSVALSTSAPSTPQSLFTNFATTMREQVALGVSRAKEDIESDLAALLASASSNSLASVSLTAATTLWRSLISAATSELKKCDFPKEVSPMSVITFAASNAQDNLREALKVVKKLVNDEITTDIITAFKNRRETTYQRQVGEYAGTMADINAVNSSAFMFGMALLRSEQQREVADFDAQISFQLLERGLSAYIQSNLAHLQTAANVELANAQAHNALLEASIQLLTVLNSREEITPKDLLAVYNGLFASEMQLFSFMAQAGIESQSNLYGQNIRRDQVNHGLHLQADSINKEAKERRYQAGQQQVLQLLTNRVEFEKIASMHLTEQNQIKAVARSQYESLEIEDAEREALWKLNVSRMGAEIFAAPSGMAAMVPKMPHPAMQIAGVAVQGLAAVSGAAGSQSR